VLQPTYVCSFDVRPTAYLSRPSRRQPRDQLALRDRSGFRTVVRRGKIGRPSSVGSVKPTRVRCPSGIRHEYVPLSLTLPRAFACTGPKKIPRKIGSARPSVPRDTRRNRCLGPFRNERSRFPCVHVRQVMIHAVTPAAASAYCDAPRSSLSQAAGSHADGQTLLRNNS